MSKKVKTIAVIGLILAAIIGASAFFGQPGPEVPPETDGSLTSSASKAAGIDTDSLTPTSTEFSELLATITSISIDTSLFDNAAYKTLRDYPITLGSDIKGRPNPFAPVGTDTGTISGFTQATKVQFETIQPSKITSTTAEFGAQALLSNTTNATVVFEYGTNDLLGSGTTPVALSQNGTALFRVNGLAPGTLYYVRAILDQGAVTTSGNIMNFTTLPAR